MGDIINIIYIRVSTEDLKEQDPRQQLDAIIEKFSLKDYELYEERGSAYNLDKINKRKEFLKILNICFDAENKTIQDLYLHNYNSQEIHLYVWDYSRIMRNIELNLFFSLLANWFNVKIHSCKDKNIIKETDNETPTAKLTRIMMNTISAFSSEEYSYTISTNTKKSLEKKGNITYSKYGNKCGRRFVNNKGEQIELKEETIKEIYNIVGKATKKKKIKYDYIIDFLSNKYDIKVSKSWISKIKKEFE